MKRKAFFVYGVAGHLAFLAIYAWFGAFVAGLPVPRSIDTLSSHPVPVAVAINLGLIALFAVQHSVMARPWFKRVWTRIIPQPIERSTYVWVSNALVALLILGWQGVGPVVWDVHHPTARMMLWGLFAAGWVMVPAVSLMINHFDLFGTRQVWLHLRGRPYESLPFRTPALYARMRHPLYVGWAIAFWATPTMTLGHLIFAAALTLYMIVAARFFEERDLVAHYGATYRAYQRRVPMFVPRLGGRYDGESAEAIAADVRPAPRAAV
jgi:protein-S-isoprenylcysteine O-methyltransferase Ste14